jgi:hypothetical protein
LAGLVELKPLKTDKPKQQADLMSFSGENLLENDYLAGQVRAYFKLRNAIRQVAELA